MSGLSQEEKLVRIGRMTGSSFAALLGRSPYQPPSEAWAAQMGFKTVEENLPMAMGNIYEDAIRKAAQHKLVSE